MPPFAKLLVLAGVLAFSASCTGKSSPRDAPPPTVPHSAPARDMIVRTDRFALHVNAYVAFYARAFTANDSSKDSARDDRMDSVLVAKLGGCSDDPCANKALAGSPFAGELAAYLADTWVSDADDARRSLVNAAFGILALEDLIAPTLAAQVGRTWPNDPIDVFFARAPRVDPSGRDGPLVDTQGECFGNNALLECAFTYAVETLLPDSELGKGVAEARAAQSETDRSKSDAAVPCLAALAVDAAVTAADAHYRPTRRFAEACAPGLRVWLGDTWAKRIKGEIEAKAFGGELVRAMAR